MSQEPKLNRPFWILTIISLFVVGGFAYLQYSRVDKSRRRGHPVPKVEPLPVLGSVSDFKLTERSGKQVSRDDLKGRVWIADFFFISCGGPCPIMTNRMRDLQETFRAEKIEGVLTVSITVDPETDTPEELTGHATMKGADEFDWYFLTGKTEEIYELSIKGFKLTAQRQEGEQHEVEHSPRFILVDRKGDIRAYYEIVTDEEIFDKPRGEVINKPMAPETKKKILADVRQLLREPA